MKTTQFNQTELSTPQNEGLQINPRENESLYDNQNPDQTNDVKTGHSSEALNNILVGALWCVGGIVVTAVTYSAASEGGTFIVAWGAILFGGWQFLKGLFQLI